MKGAQNSMTGDVKATHLSRRLQVIADQILLGGRCAIEECSGEPAHAQEQVGEAQVEKRTNLGKAKWVSRSQQWSQRSHDHLQQ